MGENNSNETTNKGLISKIYKQFIQLNAKKNKQPNQKVGKSLQWFYRAFGLPLWLSSKKKKKKKKKIRLLMQVQFLCREDPWRRKWQATAVILPGKSHGQRSLVGYSPWDCKKSTQHTHPHAQSLHGSFQISFPQENHLKVPRWLHILTAFVLCPSQNSS